VIHPLGLLGLLDPLLVARRRASSCEVPAVGVSSAGTVLCHCWMLVGTVSSVTWSFWGRSLEGRRSERYLGFAARGLDVAGYHLHVHLEYIFCRFIAVLAGLLRGVVVGTPQRCRGHLLASGTRYGA
jgi:hypothetical protein